MSGWPQRGQRRRWTPDLWSRCPRLPPAPAEGPLPRSRGPERGSTRVGHLPKRKNSYPDARVLTICRCEFLRDGQGQEEDKEGQIAGQSQRCHHIHRWELGKRALGERKREKTQVNTCSRSLVAARGGPRTAHLRVACSALPIPSSLRAFAPAGPSAPHMLPSFGDLGSHTLSGLRGLSERAHALVQKLGKLRPRKRKDSLRSIQGDQHRAGITAHLFPSLLPP